MTSTTNRGEYRRAVLASRRATKRRLRAERRAVLIQGYATTAGITGQRAARKPLPDTRSSRKKGRDKAYAALPALKVLKPLEFIQEQHPGTVTFDLKGNRIHTPDPVYVGAKKLAAAGKGGAVQRIARGLTFRPA